MIYIFLPAYNEEQALPILVKKFSEVLKKHQRDYRVVVLDDGSSDKTFAVATSLAREYPIEILRHETNQGLGQTLIDGFNHLFQVVRDEDKVVTLDCDDTHEPSFLPAALDKLEEGYDLVILSRFCQGGGQEGLSTIKKTLSIGAGLFLKFFFPIRGVREYSCNYRVFGGRILRKAFEFYGNKFIGLPHLGFVATPEILIKMRKIGAKITESPFVLRYDQKTTPSKNNSLRTIRGYFALIWHYWLR